MPICHRDVATGSGRNTWFVLNYDKKEVVMPLNKRRIQLSIQRKRMLRDTQRKISSRRNAYYKQCLME